MSERETKYAAAGLDYVAYQALGNGDLDLLVLHEWLSHQEMRWEQPEMARFYERLQRFARVITFDRRGCGLSDPAPPNATWMLEDWADDVTGVLDACSARCAAIMGIGGGGPLAMLYAATHPGRVSALVLVNTASRYRRAPDYPIGVPDSIADAMMRADTTGNGDGIGYGTPYDRAMFGARADDPVLMAFARKLMRMSASPASFRAMTAMLMSIDVRGILPSITVPTLVLHRRGDQWTRVEHGRYLAEHIPGARLVELDGDAHAVYLEGANELIDEVEEFLTGSRSGSPDDRVLATVLFSDIVGSTRLAAELGDERWADLLAAHHAAVRRQLARHRGREVDTAGDGFLAVFDGPGRAIACAVAIRDAVRPLGLDVRLGLHSGECQVVGDDVRGLAVHIAARIMSLADAGQVLVSQTVKDLVSGSNIGFADAGRHRLKGVPEAWQIYEAT